MKRLTTIGRILFAIPFGLFGMLIATSISIITKILVKFSTLMLAVLLFTFIVTIHIPHLFTEADKTVSIIALLKDISLLGGSLMISGMYAEEEKPEE
jgi:putative oxidoreductase